jgi:hypothetical protein
MLINVPLLLKIRGIASKIEKTIIDKMCREQPIVS